MPVTDGWEWDPTLYAGSAAFYPLGRVAYPTTLVETLVAHLGLDGRGRLLDVGCGPGSLTLRLAPCFDVAVGLDADAGMLAEASRQARAGRVANVTWVRARAEHPPAGLGSFDVVTLAQSFHWMDRPRVAGVLHGLVELGGVLLHVHATTHQGVDGSDPLAHPRPPRREIGALVEHHLGSRRRAGRGTLPDIAVDETARGVQEAQIYTEAGFSDPVRLEVPGWVATRTADEVVASVFSLSSAAPHLFGGDVAAFEADLRAVLARAAPDGVFSERLREIAVDVWRA